MNKDKKEKVTKRPKDENRKKMKGVSTRSGYEDKKLDQPILPVKPKDDE